MMDEQAVLRRNPFEGAFGELGDRLLSDKMVTARKGGVCHDCAGQIHPGERIRTRAEIVSNRMMRWRWCQDCCEAMAIAHKDGGKAEEARFRLRRQNLEAGRAALEKEPQR